MPSWKIVGGTCTSDPLNQQNVITLSGSSGPSTGAPTNTFVYRPGADSVSENVYNSWSALMTARALVQGPAVVAIDDSIGSPAIIPDGTWDLTSNTALVSYRSAASAAMNTLTWVQLPSANGSLKNSTVWRDLQIVAPTGASSPVTSDSGLTIDSYDCAWGGEDPFDGQICDPSGQLVCNLYGSSVIFGGSTKFGGSGFNPTVAFNLFDASSIEAGSLAFDGGGAGTVTVNTLSPTAFYDVAQPGIANTTIVGEATYTGVSGSLLNVLASQTTLAAGSAVRIDSFVAGSTLTGSGGIKDLVRFPCTLGTVDGAISIVGVGAGGGKAATDVYRGDMFFTGIASGGHLAALVLPAAPNDNPINERTHGSLGVQPGIVASSDDIRIYVTQPVGSIVKYSVIAQLQWRLP